MMTMHVTIGLVQMSCSKELAANLEKAIQRIEEAANRGANVVCLQELFSSQYFPRVEDATHFKLAEPIPGPTTDQLARLAALKGIVIVASLFEKRAAGVYHNTAVVIDADGTLVGKYRKMHIPDDPAYYEKFYFTPGDLGFPSFKTHFGKIGVLVCWDQWFPEAARLVALSGAQILFYPTAIGWDDGSPDDVRGSQHAAWETVQRGHAISNGMYVAPVNRVGKEGSLQFWGASFVSDPFGQVIAYASHDQEEVLLATCDFSKIDETRETWPFLRDRRVDAYSPITSRFLE